MKALIVAVFIGLLILVACDQVSINNDVTVEGNGTVEENGAPVGQGDEGIAPEHEASELDAGEPAEIPNNNTDLLGEGDDVLADSDDGCVNDVDCENIQCIKAPCDFECVSGVCVPKTSDVSEKPENESLDPTEVISACKEKDDEFYRNSCIQDFVIETNNPEYCKELPEDDIRLACVMGLELTEPEQIQAARDVCDSLSDEDNVGVCHDFVASI